MCFVTLTTTTAAIQMITHHYWPPNASTFTVGANIALIILILSCAYTIFINALFKSTPIFFPKNHIQKATITLKSGFISASLFGSKLNFLTGMKNLCKATGE